MDRPDTILIYAINRTDAWWKHVGENLGFARNVVVTDIRGKGDCDVIDDFYDAYRRQRTQPNAPMAVLSAEEVDDVIARCRLLRWLPTRHLALSLPVGLVAYALAFRIVGGWSREDLKLLRRAPAPGPTGGED